MQPGQVLEGRFALTRPLGEGLSGSVWLAVDQTQGQAVAVKMLHPRHVGEVRWVDRFEREIKILTRLEHPNIAKAIAWSLDEKVPYLAMEFAVGRSLEEELLHRATHQQSFSLTAVSDVIAHVASALDHAHSMGVVHRDLKPANVVVPNFDDPSTLKVIDFGIAGLSESHDKQTTHGRVLGTKYYLAPEQVSGDATPRTDVFALATVCYELLTMRKAWGRDADDQPLFVAEEDPANNAPVAVLDRILNAKPVAPSTFSLEVSSTMDDLILGAMAPEAADRPATPGAFAQAFADAIAGAAGDGTQPVMVQTAILPTHVTRGPETPSPVSDLRTELQSPAGTEGSSDFDTELRLQRQEIEEVMTGDAATPITPHPHPDEPSQLPPTRADRPQLLPAPPPPRSGLSPVVILLLLIAVILVTFLLGAYFGREGVLGRHGDGGESPVVVNAGLLGEMQQSLDGLRGSSDVEAIEQRSGRRGPKDRRRDPKHEAQDETQVGRPLPRGDPNA